MHRVRAGRQSLRRRGPATFPCIRSRWRNRACSFWASSSARSAWAGETLARAATHSRFGGVFVPHGEGVLRESNILPSKSLVIRGGRILVETPESFPELDSCRGAEDEWPMESG